MTDFLTLLNDPNLRLAMPFVREGIGWALDAVRKKRENAPEHPRQAADENLKQFAGCLIERLVERVKTDEAAQRHVNENVQRPDGVSEVERALDAATEIDDQFTRENLAGLVARAMTSRRDSAEKISTRIATDASKYLGERQLRLLAFMSATQGTRPGAVAATPEQWTAIVIPCSEIMCHG